MAKSNKEKLLNYLWSVAPRGADNAEIREAIGSQLHQSDYMFVRFQRFWETFRPKIRDILPLQ